MFKIIGILFLVSSLSACSVFKSLDVQEQVVIHPELPRAITPLNIKWRVIELENEVYIGTEYNEFLIFMEHEADILRYIEQSKSVICYYREELKELYCVKENN